MRYFHSRQEAGQMLAKKLAKYKNKKCVVVSLSEGGVIIGIEIAKTLKCDVFMLVTEDVELPGELDPIGTVSSAGIFTYNLGAYPAGELEYINADFRTIIDQNRLKAFQKLNRIAAEDNSEIPKKVLKNHVVILVSDGLRNGLSLDVAEDFLKPIKLKQIVIATPLASVQVTDKMHLMADKIACLGVVEEFISTDHYYDDNTMPGHKTILSIMKEISVETQMS